MAQRKMSLWPGRETAQPRRVTGIPGTDPENPGGAAPTVLALPDDLFKKPFGFGRRTASAKRRLLRAALFQSFKSSTNHASKRLRADLLRNWMRREVSRTIAPDCTS